MQEKKPQVTGWVSEKYESGGRGVLTVSKGWGDAGGISYGKHQLSSKTGTMARFLSSKFGAPFTEFKGLRPGTEEFNAVYKSVAIKRKAEFEEAQTQYIVDTHYEPQAKKLADAGFDISGRHVAVREMVFSTAVQYGPNTSIILKSGVNKNMTDEEVIRKVQQYKRDSVGVYFRSSSVEVQQSIAKRCVNEMQTLIDFIKVK